MRGPCTAARRQPRSLQLERALAQQGRRAQQQIHTDVFTKPKERCLTVNASGGSSGRRCSGPPPRGRRVHGAQLLAEAAGRATVPEAHAGLSEAFWLQSRSWAPSKGGSLRLPSPLLRPSLDPGARRLEEELGLGGRREALLCSDGQVFVLFSSCSWARLDGLTEPQKLGASKAPPSGGGFS